MTELTETAVGQLSGTRVGVANVMKSSYTLPDGSSSRGMTAQLFIENAGNVIVGAGSEVVVGGRRWVVVSVEKGLFGKGKVHLREKK